MQHVLIQENLIDPEFITHHAEGFETLKKRTGPMHAGMGVDHLELSSLI